MKDFFKQWWKYKSQWIVWLRIGLIPFAVMLTTLTMIGNKAEELRDYVDDSLPKVEK